MKISINQVEYSTREGAPLVHIFGREEDGTLRHIVASGFRPYFYIAEQDKNEPLPPVAVVEDKDYMSIHGKPVKRVYTNLPSDIPAIRDRYKHYEADVLFTVRFLVDNNLTGGVETPSENTNYQDLKPARVDSPPRVCILDIECDSDIGFPSSYHDPIIAITCWDSYTRDYTTFLLIEPSQKPVDTSKCKATNGGCFGDHHTIFQFRDEKFLLIAFGAYIKNNDPDILSGWNSTDFDIPYIKDRMNALGLSPSLLARLPGESDKVPIRGRSAFDLLTGYKKLQDAQKESYRLDAIAEYELGDKKVRYAGTMNALWRTQPIKLIEYNFKDVELCVGINEKDDIINFYVEVSRFVGCSLEATVVSSSVIDVYILRRAHGKYVLPSKGHAVGEQYEGAIVFLPSRGVKENVVVLDLRALYPMCMMTMNASPETKDPNGRCHSPNGVRFKCKPDGLTRTIVAELMAERDRKKNEMKKLDSNSNEFKILDMQQKVLKIIMNTYYGVSGYTRFRLYDPDIGSAVTATGREILEYTREIIEKEGYTVIYGDSVGKDSMVCINGSDVKISDAFQCVDEQKGGCEYFYPKDYFTDTIDESGNIKVAKIRYIMRHKTDKKMYRVWLTNCWFIDVTEDHSLFGYVGRAKSRKPAMERIVPVKVQDIGNSVRSIVVRKKKPHTYNKSSTDFDISSVLKIEELPYEDYVYDIEVDDDSHRFFANNVLVHNTDSCMIQLPTNISMEEIIDIGRKLEKKLNDSYPAFAKEKLNSDENYFSIKFEKVYRRFFQAGKKKRYAGHLIWKEGKPWDEITVTGFEIRRSDYPQITKDAQQTVLNLILRGGSDKEMRQYLGKLITGYRKGKYDLDTIGIPGGIQKEIDTYEHDDAHIRGVKYSNMYLGTEFRSGSKPKRIYISRVVSKYPKTDVICFEYGDRVPKEFIVDYETMIEKTIRKPIMRLLEPLGLEWAQIDPEVTTLADWN